MSVAEGEKIPDSMPAVHIVNAVNVREKLRADIRFWGRTWKKEPGLLLFLRLLLLEPGYQLALNIRLQELAGRVPLAGMLLRRMIWLWATRKFGSDIDPGADIGPGIYLPHPYGIVIGGDCKVGTNVCILQHVTLGRNGSVPSGPVIGDGSTLNAGAVIVGPITVGSRCRIGANAVVLCDVPDDHVAVGVPARILVPKALRSTR
jgi:serine O-acetyltransferase